jgi:hypothetical protein
MVDVPLESSGGGSQGSEPATERGTREGMEHVEDVRDKRV